jgi:phosphoenolpyruvate---glycerone phosphotransferase subunit DhaM
MTVGLVIVSHSVKIAEGVVDLAGQMAEGVALIAAGGTDDDGIGTSFDRVSTAIGEADSGDGVVVLCDLGSAILTAETALDFLDDDARVRVVIADAPLVEGSVAAAVAARTGEDLAGVTAAAEGARGDDAAVPDGPGSSESAPASESAGAASRTVTLVNASGLHARPAAEFVKAASEFDARVTVQGVDAKSLLRIMALGLAKGTELQLTAEGPDQDAALDALVALVETGFGEE